MPSGMRATRREQRRDRRRRGGDAGGDREARRAARLPSARRCRRSNAVAPLGKVDRARARPGVAGQRSIDQLAARRATSASAAQARRLRRPPRASAPGSISSISSASSVRARSAASRSASAAAASPRTIDASVSNRSSGSIAGGIGSARRSGSSAPPIRSSSSGSPIGISRGSSSPPPLARTKASVTRAHRAVVGQQDPALRASASGSLPKRCDQAGGERVGERAVRRDGEDRGRSAAPSGILQRRFRQLDRLRACRRRTTGPGGPRRSSGLPRSRGPTGCWSRTALRARRAAAASTPSGCR